MHRERRKSRPGLARTRLARPHSAWRPSQPGMPDLCRSCGEGELRPAQLSVGHSGVRITPKAPAASSRGINPLAWLWVGAWGDHTGTPIAGGRPAPTRGLGWRPSWRHRASHAGRFVWWSGFHAWSVWSRPGTASPARFQAWGACRRAVLRRSGCCVLCEGARANHRQQAAILAGESCHQPMPPVRGGEYSVSAAWVSSGVGRHARRVEAERTPPRPAGGASRPRKTQRLPGSNRANPGPAGHSRLLAAANQRHNPTHRPGHDPNTSGWGLGAPRSSPTNER